MKNKGFLLVVILIMLLAFNGCQSLGHMIMSGM